MDRIRTRWANQIDKNNPLSEYPRPQLERQQWTSLNGLWEYKITGLNSELPDNFDGQIIVPFAVESELSGVQRALLENELLWYRKKFDLNSEYVGKRVILHFGAVDWQCSVYINGKFIGEHIGGYCPFSFDITDYIAQKDNEIIVRVFDPTDKGWQQRGKQVLSTHGFWYTATSGIWQTVWMEAVDSCRINKIKLLPDIDNSVINIETELTCTDDVSLKACVYDGQDEIFCGEISLSSTLFIPNQKLWSPETPFLYDIVLEVYKDNVLCDKVKSYFGMRKFSIENDSQGIPRLYLNNEPYFQRGLLDQGYYCESVLTPQCDEAMINDIIVCKKLGFNMLRKHIKVEPLRWYYHCDRLGMIVWQDMISGGAWIGNLLGGIFPHFNIKIKDNKYKWFSREKEEARNNYKCELNEMVDTLYNCVSIGCWVPFNEGWGQFDAKQIASELKKKDPSRIIDHASGWYDQGGCDLKSVHKYVFSVHMPKTNGRPFVLSEFGGYSQTIDGHVWNKRKSFGYKMYLSKKSLTKAYKKLMQKQIIPLIEKGLSAFIYTQVSDVEFEVNGIMTYDREIIKIDEKTIYDLNKECILGSQKIIDYNID